jgi:hypothetical protein
MPARCSLAVTNAPEVKWEIGGLQTVLDLSKLQNYKKIGR